MTISEVLDGAYFVRDKWNKLSGSAKAHYNILFGHAARLHEKALRLSTLAAPTPDSTISKKRKRSRKSVGGMRKKERRKPLREWTKGREMLTHLLELY
jgi:hypothetical protein